MEPKKSHRLPYGSGSFYYRDRDGLWVGAIMAGWTPSGARRRIVVTGRDEQATWDKLTAARKRVAAGEIISKRAPTIQTYAGDWITRQQSRLRPGAWRGYRSYVQRWITPLLGAKRVDTLTPADLRAVEAAILDAGRSSTTAAKVVSVLQSMMRDAVVDGWRIPEGVLLARKPSDAVSDRTAIPLAPALRLITTAAGEPDAARWVAALLQGMRQGECLGLTWDCIDWDADELAVDWQLVTLTYADRTKGNFVYPHGYEHRQLAGTYHLARPKSRAGERRIPLVPWMRASLEQWREAAPASPHGLVWPTPDGSPRNAAADRRAWRALCDRAEVWKTPGTRNVGGGWSEEPNRYVLHEARHTAASLLLAAGVDVKVVEAIMGHSSVAMSRHYQHASARQVREALEASARQLGLTGQAGG